MKHLYIFLTFLLYFTVCDAQSDSIFNHFKVVQEQDQAIIIFTVKGGVQCSGVRIQHSTDSIAFNSIYEFPGVCGSPAGDETYTYTHDNPVKNKINYYRLEVGNLGIYSDTVSYFYYYTGAGKLLITPNPCTRCEIHLPQLKGDNYTIMLFNNTGNLLYKAQGRSEKIALTEYLPAHGTYHILILYTSGFTLRASFIYQ